MADKQLEFSWKYKNYELVACPKHLARFSADEPNETIDFVYWTKEHNGKSYCFSLAYFTKGSEGYTLRFVGDRPFRYIEKEDIQPVWCALDAAQKILDIFFELPNEEDDF